MLIIVFYGFKINLKCEAIFNINIFQILIIHVTIGLMERYLWIMIIKKCNGIVFYAWLWIIMCPLLLKNGQCFIDVIGLCLKSHGQFMCSWKSSLQFCFQPNFMFFMFLSQLQKQFCNSVWLSVHHNTYFDTLVPNN